MKHEQINNERYNYDQAVTKDVLQAILDKYTKAELIELLKTDRDAFEEKLNDDLWNDDAVTGNGSGSYTFNRWDAEYYICHNMELLCDALKEFGCDVSDISKGAEYCDVTIRCYLLPGAINDVLNDLETELLK